MKIEHFQFGRIIIDGKQYERDLIVLPHMILENWWRANGHIVTPKDAQEIISRKPEIVIFGLGTRSKMTVETSVEDTLRSYGIICHMFDTNKAVHIYNAYGDRAIAALHLTC